jgi:hypothetical protein
MATHYNPALHEEPQNQPTKIVPLIPRESLLSWLESSGRFRSSEVDELPSGNVSEDIDDILELEIYVTDNEEESLE